MQSKPCELCGATTSVVDTVAYVAGRSVQRRVCCERFGCLSRRYLHAIRQQNGLAAETSQAVA